MADELVHYTVDNGVATITLDSPHNRNALSAQLRRELRDRLAAAAEDDTVRVIVLDHTGPVFCAGMDLKEAGSPDSSTAGVNEFPEILTRIWTSPKPVVAKLAGPARAGGVGMVAAADIAVAVDSATFAFTEVRLGLVPAVISVTVLPRLLPRAAHELFLTGEKFDAGRAVEVGLLNAAVPADRLDAEVDALHRHARARRPDGTRRHQGHAPPRPCRGPRRRLRRHAGTVRRVLRRGRGPGGHPRVRREAQAELGA